MISVVLIVAYVLDECLGEPKRLHPLVGFGKVAQKIENRFYKQNGMKGIVHGALAWCLSVVPIVFACYSIISYLPLAAQWVLNSVVLYLAIGQNSLKQHGLAVYHALVSRDMTQARYATAMIVSRDTSQSDEQQLASATIETVTENTNDAVIAPLFYFVLFGVVGVVLFRLVNTLDAMWGYRNEKYEYFGKVAARMDDILGFIPARITATIFFLLRPDRWRSTLSSILGNGRKWYSPNAGIVMAAGAGALNVQLGGNAVYHGQEKPRLTLGFGQKPHARHIKHSITLMYMASVMFVCIVALIEWSMHANQESLLWP